MRPSRAARQVPRSFTCMQETPLTAAPLQKAELFAKIIRIIRSECDVIINTSTGGGPNISVEERIAIIPRLAADPSVKPEMASLNCGSLNFGMLDRKNRKFLLNDVQMNPWESMLHFADTLKKQGVTPELEIYDSGMVNNALVLQSLDALSPPLHFQFVLGVLGGLPATTENLVFLKNSIPKAPPFSRGSRSQHFYAWPGRHSLRRPREDGS